MAKHRRKKNNLSNKLALFGITLVVGMLALTVGIRSRSLKKQEQTYIMKEEALTRQIEEEEQRTELLNEKKTYVTTKQYIEDVAKEKMGLIEPDEVLLKEKEQ